MSPSSPIPPVRIPVPSAVGLFKARLTPEHIVEAAVQSEDAERELLRFRGPLLSLEDQQDREYVLSVYARADKVLSAQALRPLSPTAVLS